MHMHDKLHWIYTAQDLSPIFINWIPKARRVFLYFSQEYASVSMDCYINHIYQNCEGATLFFHP